MKNLLTIRNGLGVCLLVAFFKLGNRTLLMQATGPEAMMERLMPAVGAISCLILAACFFSASLADFLSRPFFRFVDGIYFGSDDREPPPVTLKLARIYRQELRHEDAISECERQLEYHPRSLELWTELIRSAQESGDAEAAREYYGKARRRLKEEDRAMLEQAISQPGAWGRQGGWKALR